MMHSVFRKPSQLLRQAVTATGLWSVCGSSASGSSETRCQQLCCLRPRLVSRGSCACRPPAPPAAADLRAQRVRGRQRGRLPRGVRLRVVQLRSSWRRLLHSGVPTPPVIAHISRMSWSIATLLMDHPLSQWVSFGCRRHFSRRKADCDPGGRGKTACRDLLVQDRQPGSCWRRRQRLVHPAAVDRYRGGARSAAHDRQSPGIQPRRLVGQEAPAECAPAAPRQQATISDFTETS